MGLAGEIKAGGAYVPIRGDLTELDRSLKLIQGKFDAVGNRLKAIGAGVAAIGTGLILQRTVIDPVSNLITSFADAGSTVADMSARVGIGAQSLSELSYAAGLSGTDLGTVEGAIKKLQVNIVKGSKTFAELGINIDSIKKLKPDEQFDIVAKKIAAITDPARKTATAVALLGKSGAALIPMINDLDKLRAEARDLGVTFDDVDASRADELGDAFDRVKGALAGIGNRVASSIADPIVRVANVIANVVGKVSNWIKANEDLVRQIAFATAAVIGIGSAVAAVSVAVIGVGATLSAIGAVFGSIATVGSAVFGAIGAVLGTLLTPIGLITAGIIGIGGAVLYIGAQSTGALTVLSTMFGQLGQTAATAWAGIVAAVSSGNLELAGQIAFTALEIAWLQVTTSIQDAWTRVSGFLVDIWLNIVERIASIGFSLYNNIVGVFDLISTAATLDFIFLRDTVAGVFDNIFTAIQKAWNYAKSFFGFMDKSATQQANAALDKSLNSRGIKRQESMDAALQKTNDQYQDRVASAHAMPPISTRYCAKTSIVDASRVRKTLHSIALSSDSKHCK